MNVYVCAGSSCHVKGSYKIIELMRKAIEEYDLADKVQLKAAFCMGECGERRKRPVRSGDCGPGDA